MFRPNSIILYVDDVGRSTRFYKDITHSDPIETYEDFSVFALTETFILGLQSKHAIDPKPHAVFGGFELCLSDITVEEVDTVYKEWKEKNIPIAMAPTYLDFGYTFVALDPDGHRLRVCATDTTTIK